MQEATLQHESVLLAEVVSYLRPRPEQTSQQYVIYDGTLGGAGHARALLETSPNVFVVGVDRDTYALERAASVLEEFSTRVACVHGAFSEIEKNLQQGLGSLGVASEHVQCHAMLVDLGVSSFQLDIPERGFSFRHDAPLDMRMDPTQSRTAAQVVNDYEPTELKRVLQRGGVGEHSGRVARAIVAERPLESTVALSELCVSVLAPFFRSKKQHPATVVFQAIRIEVNGEFEEIERFLDSAPTHLAPGATMGVISFHSSEDKLVAVRMRDWTRAKQPLREIPQADVPAIGELLTKQAITPSNEEQDKNPRARSALLRVFRKFG